MTEEKNRTLPDWLKIVITAAAIIVVIAAVFFIVRAVADSRRKNAVASGEGMYGTWISDYSECIVTIDEDGTVSEVNGISTATAHCSVEQLDEGRYRFEPQDGAFLFADYYIYEEIGGTGYLTSYIYLDLQQKVREEYISYYKRAE